jgi:hypothetical protein
MKMAGAQLASASRNRPVCPGFVTNPLLNETSTGDGGETAHHLGTALDAE